MEKSKTSNRYSPEMRARDWQVYEVRKTWRQLCREGDAVARCTVARHMAYMGLRGAVHGKAVKTTIPDTSAPCPRDKVNRKFRAPSPNMLRPVSDAKRIAYRVTGQRLDLCLNMAGLRLRRPSPLGLNQWRLQWLDDRHLRQPRSALVSNQWRQMSYSDGRRRYLPRPTSSSPLGRFAVLCAEADSP